MRRVQERLVLEHVGRNKDAGALHFRFKRARFDETRTGHVDQKRAISHRGQIGSCDNSACRGRQAHMQADNVRRCEERLAALSEPRPFRIMVNRFASL
ncbi:MAG: hypothetical protein OXJ64_01020 [Boseongicola sp.]|nr:hypothetical protein [Boseongicola sp.]